MALILVLLASCTGIREVSSKIEESHNALYTQKALLVYAVKDNKVWLTNPAQTHCYFLRGKQYTLKWEPGDTLIIDHNLEDFYHLKFAGECK